MMKFVSQDKTQLVRLQDNDRRALEINIVGIEELFAIAIARDNRHPLIVLSRAFYDRKQTIERWGFNFRRGFSILHDKILDPIVKILC